MPIQNQMGDYMFLLLPYFAEILANTDVPEKIAELRFRAMCNLHARLAWYEKRGYVPEILCAIAQKKGQPSCRLPQKQIENGWRGHIVRISTAESLSLTRILYQKKSSSVGVKPLCWGR